MPKSKIKRLVFFIGASKEERMKYLFACLVIPSVQILFILAFTVFALSIGISTVIGKLKPGKISD